MGSHRKKSRPLRKRSPQNVPWSETLTAPAHSGFETNWDRILLWGGVAVLLILLAYGPFFLGYLPPDAISRPYPLY